MFRAYLVFAWKTKVSKLLDLYLTWLASTQQVLQGAREEKSLPGKRRPEVSLGAQPSASASTSRAVFPASGTSGKNKQHRRLPAYLLETVLEAAIRFGPPNTWTDVFSIVVTSQKACDSQSIESLDIYLSALAQTKQESRIVSFLQLLFFGNIPINCILQPLLRLIYTCTRIDIIWEYLLTNWKEIQDVLPMKWQKEILTNLIRQTSEEEEYCLKKFCNRYPQSSKGLYGACQKLQLTRRSRTEKLVAEQKELFHFLRVSSAPVLEASAVADEAAEGE